MTADEARKISSLAKDADTLKQDMAAIIHQGESIVPANFAEGMRSNGFGAGGNGGGPNITLSPIIQIHAMDSKDVIAKFRNPTVGRALANYLAQYLSLNPSTRPNYT